MMQPIIMQFQGSRSCGMFLFIPYLTRRLKEPKEREKLCRNPLPTGPTASQVSDTSLKQVGQTYDFMKNVSPSIIFLISLTNTNKAIIPS